MRTQCFVAFSMMGDFYMLIHSFLCCVCLVAVFKDAGKLYFWSATFHFMLVLAFDGGEELEATFTSKPVLLVGFLNPLILIPCDF